jgi:hypothetical protein
MVTVGPGEAVTIVQSGIPTGQTVGYQVVKAATGSVAIGRTTTGVAERPSGSGNYVITLTAPAEVDLYIIVLDWAGGVLSPSTSKSEELQVTSSAAQADTGLGEVADRVKLALGGESFKLLAESPEFGPSFISVAIETIKNRVMTTPVAVADEGTLPAVVLSYLGKLAALELLPAVADIWGTQPQSKSVGNDPAESVTYPSREAILKMLADRLVAGVRAEQNLALSLIDDARLLDTSSGPSIDEDALSYVTRDPRTFPRQRDFPGLDVMIGVSGDTDDRYGP